MRHMNHINLILLAALLGVCILPQASAQQNGPQNDPQNDQTSDQTSAEKTTAKTKKSAKRVKSGGVKELSGISIIGNKEAPKSLYIVPWKNSEVGIRSSLTSGLLDESMRPIDREVFERELNFYELSHSK
ncbi:hypothetical protein MNBD_GAMMA10-2665 [hydrothermal vent metagenome]|uniref:Uncharacterized protein n=1 Tax=hydrothermal vent metagenome TaxID=652676 RepID=A0A3B0XHL8_9ZZZZ